MTWRAVSASNGPYEATARPFLETLVLAGLPDPPIHLTVDYDVQAPVEGVEYRRIDSATFRAPSPIHCLQHGDFLPAVPDADVILFTDCDILVQRPFHAFELHVLPTITHGQVWCSWNNGEGDSLLHEALRLRPVNGLEMDVHTFGGLPISRHPMYLPIYNTGVLAMTRETWLEVWEAYVRWWPMVVPLWQHHAKQQWLLSWLFERMNLDVWIWPETFHTHGCFRMVRPVPRRFQWVSGSLTVGGQVVAFRHQWLPE